MSEIRFEDRLKALHDVGNMLSRAPSVSELCRQVVELGRSRLDFDRMSIWFVDKNPDFIIGSFGVDEDGNIRNELGKKLNVKDDLTINEMRAKKIRSILRANVQLCDDARRPVGTGAHIIASIWNGEEVVGYLSCDNLIKQKPLTEKDRELLELFASTFGHLYSLKKAEEALESAYNQLKDMQYQLIQAAKMEVVGGLASGVAHEVKNPLAIIMQGVDYLSKKVGEGDENINLTLQRMRGAIKKADSIIKGLLDFSMVSKMNFQLYDISLVMEDSLALVKYELDRYNIKVIKNLGRNIPEVKIDKNKIEQVFINLFLNAIHHMPGGGDLTLRTYCKDMGNGKKIVFAEIEDTGRGIPKEALDKIFDPFFTTRRGEGGTGLGLSIVRNIIDMHKARIDIGNRIDGGGAKATLEFTT